MPTTTCADGETIPGPQLMMHGPLTMQQTEHVKDQPYGERIFRIVEIFPPLTEEQLSRLALLLTP